MGVVEVSGESTRLFMPSERKMSKLSVKAILCHLERGEEREEKEREGERGGKA